jgi:putative DNA methylase
MVDHLQTNACSNERRLIESDEFQFEFVSELAEMESWRKEIYRPIYHIHKWWAKRLGSVFRAVLLGSALPESEKLAEAFYRKHDFAPLTVFDPFLGSGTTIGEAHKLGFTALGRDINPVALEAVRVAFGPLDRGALMDAFAQLSSTVGERIRKLYETSDASGHSCDALYFFWVKVLACPSCSTSVDLFSSYIFARNAYPERKPEVRVYCPYCADIFTARITDKQVTCSHCNATFDPLSAPASGASAICTVCNHKFSIVKAVSAGSEPPAHRIFAKLVLTSSRDKQYLAASKADIEAYSRCSSELARNDLVLPTLMLEDGHNTRQAINFGYRSWRQFFNDRQLLALAWLRNAILEISDEAVRDAFLTVFSGTLEFNNLFASYKGEGTGAIRHMFSHHILKPERVPVEGNVWGTEKSSGSFATLFRSRLLRAIDYRVAPFELAVERINDRKRGLRVYGGSSSFSGHVAIDWPPSRLDSHAIFLSCGDSARTELPAESVDVVVTDPPFFDNVHYSELADFFFAWQQLGPTPFARVRSSTRHLQEVQDVSAAQFATKLRSVFEECRRVLKKQGLLVFSYHHSRTDGWLSLAKAVAGAGFSFVNCHPVKSEMSVAAPKSQTKEPIQIDVILVCRPQTTDFRLRKDAPDALGAATQRAREKALRLESVKLNLSANDKRVLLIGQFLVEASSGRSTDELVTVLTSSMADLNAAAICISEKQSPPAHYEPAPDSEPQLVLLEQPTEI